MKNVYKTKLIHKVSCQNCCIKVHLGFLGLEQLAWGSTPSVWAAGGTRDGGVQRVQGVPGVQGVVQGGQGARRVEGV